MLAESAFIEALRETPDDPALRLVYADWLDEIGDSRGELVRLQCELDQTPIGHPHRNVLHQAIQELCHQRQSDWLAPLRRRVLGWQKARFQFGLVENVAMSPTAFLHHAEAGLFDEMPHLVGVCLEGAEKPMEKALASPYIARLRSLAVRVYGSIRTDGVIEHLSTLPIMRNLTSLNLELGHHGDEAIAKLLSAVHFSKLRRLNLRDNLLTSNIARPLADSPFLPQLEWLALGSRWDYGQNLLEDVGVRILIDSTPPLKLRWLDLSANGLSDSSAWDLARASSLDHLECLLLWGNTFSPAGRTALETRFPNRVFHVHCEPDLVCHE